MKSSFVPPPVYFDTNRLYALSWTLNVLAEGIESLSVIPCPLSKIAFYRHIFRRTTTNIEAVSSRIQVAIDNKVVKNFAIYIPTMIQVIEETMVILSTCRVCAINLILPDDTLPVFYHNGTVPRDTGAVRSHRGSRGDAHPQYVLNATRNIDTVWKQLTADEKAMQSVETLESLIMDLMRVVENVAKRFRTMAKDAELTAELRNETAGNVGPTIGNMAKEYGEMIEGLGNIEVDQKEASESSEYEDESPILSRE